MERDFNKKPIRYNCTCTFVEDEEKIFNNAKNKIEIKKSNSLPFSRYHQLEVVKKLKKQLQQDGVGNNYLIQHTTGSGKSYEIVVHSITSLHKNQNDEKRMFDTIIVISDRKILDKQLEKQLNHLSKHQVL